METFCPWNCGARIKNWVPHWQKCRFKEQLGVEYLQCQYNAFHIFKQSEIGVHEDTCTNRDDYNSSDLEPPLDDSPTYEQSNHNESLLSNIEVTNDNQIQREVWHIKQTKNRNINSYNKTNISEKYLTEDEVDTESKAFYNMVYI